MAVKVFAADKPGLSQKEYLREQSSLGCWRKKETKNLEHDGRRNTWNISDKDHCVESCKRQRSVESLKCPKA
uniref:Uncharacterized protein n=1 Tax=Arion vulgaris TaxID=1028688 RepID=A0A0B7BRT2_9EUPU